MNTEASIEQLTDLEFLDLYVERCRNFINPILFRELERRGLMLYVNYLPKEINEAKAVMRGRLRDHKKYFGDQDTDKIAGEIRMMESLRKELTLLNMADAHKVEPILTRMLQHASYVRNYFK